MGYLDNAGLQHLWDRLKEKFAQKSHSHDDRYYTESEMDAKLSAKAANIVLAHNANLNDVTTPGFYSCGGGNSILNKPTGVDAIGLIVTHNASGNYYTQILTTSSNANTYRRTCLNGSWSGWTQDKYTDTNTWRGIQNNLTSDSTSDSLSAAQGKVLKGLVDGKANSSHTHTKSQITDFPISLKNPTALTIQTNGTTAATYDGSAAKTVNITKGNIGLGNVDNTADKNKSVASAAKLTTARTVSGGSDITLSFNYDGSGNSTANIGFYSCKHSIGNTNNYPFHRFARLDTNKGAWVDKSITFLISQDYSGGGYGICRLVYRSNADSGSASVDAQWLVRKGFSADTIQVAIKTDKTNGTYCDAFYKSSGTYMGVVIRAIASGGRATSGRTWTLVDSNEVDGTTATDKKTSSECWKTIADAGTDLHKQSYSASSPAKDEGYVASAGSANTSSSCTGNSVSATKLTSSAGSATQPVYFNDGKPVAIGYTIAKSVPADAKFTDTNTWRGIQNNLTSDSTDQSLSAAQGKALKALVDGKAPTSHKHTKSQITDFPTSMPASDVSAWAKAATKPTYTKAEVGLGNVDNTADKDKSVKYATSAANATNTQYLNNDSQYMRFHWNGQSGQPSWLWGGNDASNMYVYNPSNFSVNYANSAGNGVHSSNVNVWGDEGYIRFNDGIQICWGTSTSGSSSGSFTFPQRFVYQSCIMISGTGAYRYAFYVTKIDSTGFSYYRDGSGNTVSPQYVAFGRWK